jgi:hypothetical protein
MELIKERLKGRLGGRYVLSCSAGFMPTIPTYPVLSMLIQALFWHGLTEGLYQSDGVESVQGVMITKGYWEL